MADKVPGTEVIEEGALLTDGDEIVAVGRRVDILSDPAFAEEGKEVDEAVDCAGGLLLPGLIDCHTHLIFGGDRSREFEQRLEGVSYQEISRQGGGIGRRLRQPEKVRSRTCGLRRRVVYPGCVLMASPRWKSRVDTD